MRLIDADALKDRLDYCVKEGMGSTIAFTFKHMVDDAPTIEAVPKDFHDKTCEAMAKRHTEEIQRLMPKRGEWIQTSNDWIDGTCGTRYYPIHCSICNYSTYDDSATNFCPNCGADMREREGE